MYDFLIVGAGLYGAAFARLMTDAGKKCLVIDRRDHIAGNCYTESIEGINVHRYGAHIFHTNDDEVWDFVNRFADFNSYINSPVADYHGEKYNLPFNMNTFHQMWGVNTAEEAQSIIESQRTEIEGEPRNLEEQAISLVGRDIYEKLVKGYTQKQWGRPCSELPAFIIRRLPVRFTFDNNYFNAKHQGIPVGGYTKLIERMLDGIEVRLGVDYLNPAVREELDAQAEKVVYTGAIDEYFGYKLGALQYRSVRFENELLDQDDFQSNAVVNYTDSETPWTRIIEHKWFEFGKDANGCDLPKTVISREYSSEWEPGDEPYYPVNDEKNNALYAKYAELAAQEEKVIFGGRLGEYRYFDMDQVIRSAMDNNYIINPEKGFAVLTARLIELGLTISTMESCTAGLIATLITNLDGSSKAMKGSFITYSNEAKIHCGVDKDIIDTYGVYSRETAIAMAAACRIPYSADIGVGVTGTLGIIDPDNSDSVPGEVYFAIDFKGKIYDYYLKVPDQGSKFQNKIYTAQNVCRKLLEIV